MRIIERKNIINHLKWFWQFRNEGIWRKLCHSLSCPHVSCLQVNTDISLKNDTNILNWFNHKILSNLNSFYWTFSNHIDVFYNFFFILPFHWIIRRDKIYFFEKDKKFHPGKSDKKSIKLEDKKEYFHNFQVSTFFSLPYP